MRSTTGFVAWMLHVQLGINCLATFAFALAAGFALGCLTDRIAFRPIAKTDVVSLVLATVGIAFVLKGLARSIWGGKADYLVTGDKSGLLSLDRHKATQIISAVSFAALFA